MILVVVLIVIGMLTLAGFTFAELMFAERKASHSAIRLSQARAIAESGIELARQFSALDRETQDSLGGWFDNTSRFQGQLVADDDTAESRGRFSVVAPSQQDGVVTGVRYGLEDESTKLNLNMLVLVDQQNPGAGRTLLMTLPGMTEEIADSILDWMDEGDETREFGAEADYYSGLPVPYAPKNAPLESIEELLLVRGVTPELLFGTDLNRNGMTDADESSEVNVQSSDGTSDASMLRGWASYMTLYSMESNTQLDGKAKINLNSSDLKKLQTDLESALDADTAAFIVAYRQNGPYTGSSASTPPVAGQVDASKPSKVSLPNVLYLVGAKVKLTSSDPNSSSGPVWDSPFPAGPGLAAVGLIKLMETCTVNPSKTIPGRININQASRMVLKGIPGMTDEMVDMVISQRQENPTDDAPGHRYETWLYNEGICTLDQMKDLMPYVCTGGSVFRVQSMGYFEGGGPAARIEAVFDATNKPARMLFWRDISHLGRGSLLESVGSKP